MSLEIALRKIKNVKESKATKLDLIGLRLSEIPSELAELTELNELRLDSNQLVEIKGLETLTHLTKLDIGFNHLTEIKGLENLTLLTKLDLSHNELKEINGLEKLTQLTDLDLSYNELKEMKGLEKLTQLTDLDLSHNELKEIKGLEKLALLTKLNLNHNQFTEIKGLENLTLLNWLRLDYNEIAEIRNLRQLSQSTNYLFLDNNQLTELPENILELHLPIYLDTQTRGEAIYVGENPFTNPPPEIIQQGNRVIQEYFSQRKKTGKELLNEAKLILLGDGRSGKTSFSNRLLGKQLPQEADRTQGVDIVIGEYSFPLANGKDFKINIWDFAGQDKYKTLHQLFYTESSLYVMVAESGNNTTDYDDWLQTAELFGEGSPLVLVLNEFKEGIGMGSFDSSYWKKQFPELLKEVFTVNLGTKANFAKTEDYIRLLAQTLPHTKYVFPSNWAAIRRVLHERRNEQYISLQEYLKICTHNNLPERDSALILSSVLHKIGDCLHYQKSELLKQIVILKNEWATDAVYKIFDDRKVAEEKCGFFDRTDMERVWSNGEYVDTRPQLLELMKQFKLAYQLPGKEEYVTPPLLPPASPTGFVWPELDSLELYIEYEFLPKALLTQFIVTRHADIAEGRTLVWRNGVILQWADEALAEVSKTKLQGRDAFYIRSQGRNRKGMMTVILKTFRELHAEYKGIKYKEKVPCTCAGCKTGKNDQHYFDFTNLQFRLEKGRLEVECDKSLETLNVLQLLENSFVFEQMKDGRNLQLKEKVVRESVSEMRVLNLFIASSNELAPERKEIEMAISRKNDALRKQGFLIDLLIWEDGKHIGKSLRSQDNYNLEIQHCHLFAMLFYSKVGKYSLEEFELAKSLFDTEAMPRICIFQKHIGMPISQTEADAKSRFEFLKQLNELEHFPTLFDNTDKLVNELEDMIDKLLQDEGFVERLQVE